MGVPAHMNDTKGARGAGKGKGKGAKGAKGAVGKGKGKGGAAGYAKGVGYAKGGGYGWGNHATLNKQSHRHRELGSGAVIRSQSSGHK